MLSQEESLLKSMQRRLSWICKKMKSKTIRFWENVEENPPKSYKEFFEEERKFLLKHIPQNCILLDVGCGDGRNLGFFSSICKKVFGIDNDKYSIKKSKEIACTLKNVEVTLEDAEKTHFNDKTFDIIAIIGTFCNLGKTKQKVLLEMKRVLKDNGFLIITIYNENALKERLKIYNKYNFKKFVHKGNGTIIINNIISEQFSKEQIGEILNTAGFKIIDIFKGSIFYLIKSKKRLN